MSNSVSLSDTIFYNMYSQALKDGLVPSSFDEFVSTYLEDVLKFHGSRFTTYNLSLQQQIHHLSFVAKQIAAGGLVQTILEEHSIVREDLECGFITWESVEYFQKWQENLLRKLDKINMGLNEAMDTKEEDYPNQGLKEEHLSEDNTDHDKDSVEDVLIPVQIKIQKDKKRKYVKSDSYKNQKENQKKRKYVKSGIYKMPKELIREYERREKYKRVKRYQDESKATQIVCDTCENFMTTSKKNYEKHLFEKHEQTMCEVCGLNSTDFSSFYKHALTHKAATYHCKDCGESFKTEATLNMHVGQLHISDSDESKEVCPFCGKFYSKMYIKTHILHNHMKTKTLTCPQCDFIGNDPTNLKRHIKQRHEYGGDKCQWCGKHVKDMEQHLQRTQCNIPESERSDKIVVKCDTCLKEFTGRNIRDINSKLKRHIQRIHEQVRNVHCDQCSYTTYCKSNLYVHVKRMHEGRPYKEQCPHCPKVVVNLEWHLKTYHPSASSILYDNGEIKL